MSNPMTEEMQIAAVEAAMSKGKSLKAIRKEFPDLEAGVTAVENRAKTAPRRRGSGPVSFITTPRPKF